MAVSAFFRCLLDDLAVTSQSRERHELGSPLAARHVWMLVRLVMGQVDDVVVCVSFLQGHAR